MITDTTTIGQVWERLEAVGGAPKKGKEVARDQYGNVCQPSWMMGNIASYSGRRQITFGPLEGKIDRMLWGPTVAEMESKTKRTEANG